MSRVSFFYFFLTQNAAAFIAKLGHSHAAPACPRVRAANYANYAIQFRLDTSGEAMARSPSCMLR